MSQQAHVQDFGGAFRFQGSWKDTWVHTHHQKHPGNKALKAGAKRPASEADVRERRLQVDCVYSDVLYQGHLCATQPILSEWLELDTLTRKGAVSAEEFRAIDRAGMPVVMRSGAAFAHAEATWSLEHLAHCFAGLEVTAGVLLLRAPPSPACVCPRESHLVAKAPGALLGRRRGDCRCAAALRQAHYTCAHGTRIL